MSRENLIAVAVMKIAAGQANGTATFSRCRAEVPNHVKLTFGETAMSDTRPGEPMWHQIVRNIRCHYDADGNFIDRGLLEHIPKVGYRITDLGRAWLQKST
jgi:hypothetical protein